MKRRRILLALGVLIIISTYILFKKFDYKKPKTGFIDSNAISEIDRPLNPLWEEYNELNDNDKSKIQVIPEKYVEEFVYEPQVQLFGINEEDNLPSSYDLRAVNENGVVKNYVTPVKNQGSLGLCWAFSGLASVESNLLKTGAVDTESPVIFNERTIDYIFAKATDNHPYNSPNNSVKVFEEEYSPIETNRSLGSASAISNVFEVASLGYGLQSMEGDIWSNYFLDHPTLKLSEVFNLKRYIVTDYVGYSRLPRNANDTTRKAYQDMIKKHIMNYGAISILALAPSNGFSTSCYVNSTKTNDKVGLINDNADCNENAPLDKRRNYDAYHGMSIVGWNDNYEQDYCGLPNEGTARTDFSREECENQGGNYHEIRGAWIVKNSWGTYDASGYVNLAFNSYINEILGVKKTIERDFDKYYFTSVMFNNYKQSENGYVLKFKKGTSNELLKRISLKVYSNIKQEENSIYNIYISTPTKEKKFLKRIEILSNLSGLFSIDTNEYALNNEEFTLYVECTNEAKERIDSIYAFTQIQNSSEEKSADFNVELTHTGSTTMLYINFSVNNASDLETVKLKLFNSNQEDVSNIFEESFTTQHLLFGHLNYGKYYYSDTVLPDGNYTLSVFEENDNLIGSEEVKIFTNVDFVVEVENETYFGNDELHIKVYDTSEGNPRLLTLNEDYILENINYNVGIQMITIKGIGRYGGICERELIILPKDISIQIKNREIEYGDTLDLSDTIDNYININGLIEGETPIINGNITSNYTVTSQVGEYTLTSDNITLTDSATFKSNNYNVLEIKSGTLTVKPKDLTNSNVILEKEQYRYTGKQITPEIKEIILNDTLLNLTSEDFNITYGANIETTGSITITGKGNYSGSKTVTFDIVKNSTELSYRNDLELKNNYLLNIKENDTLSSLEITSNKEIKYYDNNTLITDLSTISKTGIKVTVGTDEYYLVVNGDVSGDGLIKSNDLLKVRQHLLNTKLLEGSYYIAGDINKDNKINSADLLRLRQHLLKIKNVI